MIGRSLVVLVALCALPFQAQAQSPTSLATFKGLAPVSALAGTPEGRAALSANYAVTGGIQIGEIRQPTLLPFAEQQQQALLDAFITDGNLANVADGLGTTLGAAYQARAHYIDREHFTNLSQSVADLIAYANASSAADSNAAKYFFGNGTTDGKAAVSTEALAIFKDIAGGPDVFGRSYGRAAGSADADAYGNSRPFQTEPSITRIIGRDYFGVPSDNTVYNHGPMMNLINSPSYPSGHTTYGYMGAVLLAVLVPDRYPQMVTRAAEYGNDRILMGAHYAMDVVGGRSLALYTLAHLLANDPIYMGRSLRRARPISDFQAALKRARADMTAALEAACGKAVATCANEDIGRFCYPAANVAFYVVTQTYDLPVVHLQAAAAAEDVGKLAPEAGYLLTIAFPSLSIEQANRILTETEGPGGGFLDNGSAFGVYSRIDLYAAASKAAAVEKGKH